MATTQRPIIRGSPSAKKIISVSSNNAGTESTVAIKRLRSELMALMMSNTPGISACPSETNMFAWIAAVKGAQGTVYENIEYKLDITFPESYPHTAPMIKFASPIFHPNVDNSGNICSDILKDNWSAMYDIRSVLLSLQSLLAEPNVLSPVNTKAASLWNNPDEFRKELLSRQQIVAPSAAETTL